MDPDKTSYQCPHFLRLYSNQPTKLKEAGIEELGDNPQYRYRVGLANLVKHSRPEGDDERRCQWVRRDSTRCRKWAVRGRRYCRSHSPKGPDGTQNMPRFYRRVLTKSLSEALEESLEPKPDEQVQLLEELALTRDYAGQIVRLYGLARDADEAKSTEQTRMTVKAAGAELIVALQHVQSMATSASRILELDKGKYNVQDLNYVVHQLTRIMYSVCGEEHQDLAEEFNKQVKRDLRLHSNDGTTSTPDQIVADMDDLTCGESDGDSD